nr:integrase arm-type DNA-binding domain-containing protein [uncultured Sphingomonas sp.]
MPLKELEVKYTQRRQRPFKLSDGGGLYLLVQPNGSKLWRLKYRFDGKEKLLSFGKYPKVTLAVAREKRKEAKAKLAEGIDPGAACADEPAPEKPLPPKTFEAIARAWHANREEGLDCAHAGRVLRRMERDAFPAIGDKLLAEITAPDILEMIRIVEARGAFDISRRLKQSTSQVFRFAIASGWAASDPTVHLTGALKPRPRVRHMPKVPLKEFPALVRAIVEYDGEADSRRREVTRDALMFTLLTWARTGETRFATRDEFENLDGAEPLWRLSPERMKMEREHLVPLSAHAAELVRRRLRATNGDLLFPGEKPGKPISQNTMIFACYRMGYRGRQTVHGFRGLASTWANEAERYKADWIEMALAHDDENDVRGAYNSALYLSARRRMLQDWADEIERIVADEGQGERLVDRVAAPSLTTSPAVNGFRTGRLPDRGLRKPYWQRQIGVAGRRTR